MQANSWLHKLFHFHFSFESRKCRKEEEKLQKFEDLKNKKSFLDEIRKHFLTVFDRLSFGEKIKT